MFALVDCNNFYASCERVFRPDLRGRPVVVLSNNDGCIIARSNEAKALGIEMGQPFFESEHFLREKEVEVFSSNYALYGDMSRRVMNILGRFTPRLEIYSIDEAFLDLSGFSRRALSALHYYYRFWKPAGCLHKLAAFTRAEPFYIECNNIGHVISGKEGKQVQLIHNSFVSNTYGS